MRRTVADAAKVVIAVALVTLVGWTLGYAAGSDSESHVLDQQQVSWVDTRGVKHDCLAVSNGRGVALQCDGIL